MRGPRLVGGIREDLPGKTHRQRAGGGAEGARPSVRRTGRSHLRAATRGGQGPDDPDGPEPHSGILLKPDPSPHQKSKLRQ